MKSCTVTLTQLAADWLLTDSVWVNACRGILLTVCLNVQAGMIPIQMELGGKDACIVCHDADIDLAAKNIVKVCLLHRLMC